MHNNLKRVIVCASEEQTELLLKRWKNTSRLYKSKVAEKAKKIEMENRMRRFEYTG